MLTRRLTLLGTVLALASTAGAQNVIDQQQTADGNAFALLSDRWAAQSFRPTAANLSGVGYLVSPFHIGAPGSGTVQYHVYDQRPDLAGAVPIVSGISGSVSLTGPDAVYADAFFDVPVAVTPGATYFVTGSSPGSNHLYVLAVQNPAAYPLGGSFYNDGTSPTAPYTDVTFQADLTFRTYTFVSAVVPEPSTVILMTTGLLVIGGGGAALRQRRTEG
jgi:hypothetical protein